MLIPGFLLGNGPVRLVRCQASLVTEFIHTSWKKRTDSPSYLLTSTLTTTQRRTHAVIMHELILKTPSWN